MNQWTFVLGAYAITIVSTAGLVGWTFWSMRSDEAAAEAMKRRK